MSRHQSLHHAQSIHEVVRQRSSGLEYVVVKLERGNTEIQHTLHTRPTSDAPEWLTHADLLQHLGFSHGRCSFVPGGQCIAKQIPGDFDVARFGEAVGTVFSDIDAGIRLLFECGFYVEDQLFGRMLPPVIHAMLLPRHGDGHTGSKRQLMKASEDASFEYRLSWIEGGHDGGWTFHYRPKHLPHEEMSSLLAFLGLRHRPECVEFGFQPCLWRFCNFVDTGDLFDGPADIAHRWFDAHAQKFSSGLHKLLTAHATLATFGLEFLPNVRANLSPESVQQRPEPRKC